MNLCIAEGCDRKAYGRNYCSTHYARLRRGSDMSAPIRIYRADRRPAGSGTVTSTGYKMLYKPNHPNADCAGNLSEHRFVMSELLGRPLLPGENVHHRNGDRLDNRPENLELWLNYQPRGQRVEDLVEWAEAILQRYGRSTISNSPTFVPTLWDEEV